MVCRLNQGRPVERLVLIAAMAIAVVSVARGQVAVARAARPPGGNPSTQPVPLVNSDDDLANFLNQAKKHIELKQYDQAIQILQTIISRADCGFVQEPSGRRYSSMWVKARDLIGQMGPDGLKLYRSLYDPQAQQLFEQSVAGQDVDGLRQVVRRYLHTSYGSQALEAMAAICFDRGQFVQAGRHWQAVLAMKPPGADEALLLAKIASAFHMAGESAEADKALAALKKDFPDAAAVLGGQSQKLVDYVVQLRSQPAIGGGAPRPSGDYWPGLGGFPDGLATMSDCEVVLSPRWRFPAQPGNTMNEIVSQLLAMRSSFKNLSIEGRGRGGPQMSLLLKNGVLRFRNSSGGPVKNVAVPCCLQPVMVGEAVIFRTDEGLSAFDIVTGQLLWASKLPMDREDKRPNNEYYYYGYSGTPADSLRYGMTVGDGKIFVLGDFKSEMPANEMMGMPGRNAEKTKPDNSSILAAVSIERQGSLAWKIGSGQGSADVLKSCKYLCPPAYQDGRLYVVGMQSDTYHLLCLDAANGSLIWDSAVGQSPATGAMYGNPMMSDSATCRASTPAVAQGRVFVATNAGVVAAFESDSGQAIWAYQYGNNNVSEGGWSPYMSSGYPANPLLLIQGRLVCLPADHDKVLCLNGDDGNLVWQAERSSQQYLSAIDEKRLLLSAEGLSVLSAADGKELTNASQSKGVVGRPAVGAKAVLASGDGKIIRLDLGNYVVQSIPLGDANAVLGNLLAVNNKLIASNAVGFCAYLTYDMARKALTERIAAAAPKDKPEMLMQRAQLSISARQFKAALEDFQASQAAAEAERLTGLTAQLKGCFYRTYVALGNTAENPQDMLAMFEEAQKYASTAQENAHMRLRQAKYWDKNGDFAQAAALAQAISEEFAAEEMADMPIGPGAMETGRLSPDTPLLRGKVIGQDMIQRLIRDHGRECYAKFDALAQEAMTKAAGNAQGLLAVNQQWPFSTSSDKALLAAAEIYYRQAQASGQDSAQLMGSVIQTLSNIPRNSPLFVQAEAAQAVIYARGGQKILSGYICDHLNDLPKETEIAFADIRGNLGKILADIQGGQMQPLKAAVGPVATLKTPLKQVFRISEPAPVILRDQNYRPIRLGDSFMVMQGNRVLLLDSTAADAKGAVMVSGLTSVDMDKVRQQGMVPPAWSLIGGLSSDKKILAVADRLGQGVTGIDLQTGKQVWTRTMAELGLQSPASMASGGGKILLTDGAGRIHCLDIAKGEVAWRTAAAPQPKPGGPAVYGGAQIVPTISGSYVLMRSDSLKTVICYDMSREGRLVGKWSGTKPVQYLANDDGLAVMVIDNDLVARDLKAPDKPLWVRKLPAGRDPVLLAMAGDRLVMSPQRGGKELEVLNLSEAGKTEMTLQMPDVGKALGVAVAAVMQGDSLFVTVSGPNGQVPPGAAGQIGYAMGMAVARYDLAEKKLAWKAELNGNVQAGIPALPLEIGQTHVVAVVRLNSGQQTAYVLDIQTGDVAEKLEVSAEFKATGPVMFAPAVMTNGRLALESPEGLTILGGQ